MKLWAMPCRATQDGWVTVESSDKLSGKFTGEGNGKPLQYTSHGNTMNCIKRQKGTTPKDGQEASNVLLGKRGGQPLITSERMKQLGQSRNDAQLWMCRRCKEQYRTGTWNVRSMDQGKLDMVKQEMARVNIKILGISELIWTGMGEFNTDDHYIYYCGQESLRRNGVALIINKRVQNSVFGFNLTNDRMISVCIQGKPFNITVIQVYAAITNAKQLKLNGSMKIYKTF